MEDRWVQRRWTALTLLVLFASPTELLSVAASTPRGNHACTTRSCGCDGGHRHAGAGMSTHASCSAGSCSLGSPVEPAERPVDRANELPPPRPGVLSRSCNEIGPELTGLTADAAATPSAIPAPRPPTPPPRSFALV